MPREKRFDAQLSPIAIEKEWKQALDEFAENLPGSPAASQVAREAIKDYIRREAEVNEYQLELEVTPD